MNVIFYRLQLFIMHSLTSLINQSSLLMQEVIQIIDKSYIANHSIRVDLACNLLNISIEHSGSLKFLFNNGMSISALAIFRCQFESLVRAFWIGYAANDQQVELFNKELSLENVEKSEKLPMLSKMLDELEKINSPAHGVVLQLQEFKNYSWKALNSYTHAGMHATSRSKNGFPVILAESSIRQSNNLLLIALQMLIIFSHSPEQQKIVHILNKKYKACFQV